LSQEVEPCTGDIKTRKNIKDLNEYQLKAYFDSVKALNNGPKPTIYDSFAEIHLKFAKDIHNTPLFLIWHRYFLYFMEKELQKIDPSVVIPYWDWTENNERAHEDMVFSDSYFGGRSGSDRCVIDGQFKDFKGYYRANGNNQEHCLQRKVNFTLSSTSRYVLNTNYFSLTTIDKFCNDLEYVPHGTVHSAIGGEFGTHASPNDPIFWSHHAFIDKLFYVWQKRNP
ncbi:Di-copper centre-containing protein, partial [Neoconidiobolus thromboides FSU 785]